MGSPATQENEAIVETNLDKCQFCPKRPNAYFIVTATVEYFGKLSPVMALCSEHADRFMRGAVGVTKEEAIVYQLMHS